MSIESQQEHLEHMTAGERTVLLVTGILPPLVVTLGASAFFGWSMLSGKHANVSLSAASGTLQAVVFALFIMGIVLKYWLLPALSDFFAGKVLVAEGALHLEQHFSTSSRGMVSNHCHCWVVSPTTDVSSPWCEISLWTYLRMRGKKGRSYRLYIAPHSKKLVHFRRTS